MSRKYFISMQITIKPHPRVKIIKDSKSNWKLSLLDLSSHSLDHRLKSVARFDRSMLSLPTDHDWKKRNREVLLEIREKKERVRWSPIDIAERKTWRKEEKGRLRLTDSHCQKRRAKDDPLEKKMKGRMTLRKKNEIRRRRGKEKGNENCCAATITATCELSPEWPQLSCLWVVVRIERRNERGRQDWKRGLCSSFNYFCMQLWSPPLPPSQILTYHTNLVEISSLWPVSVENLRDCSRILPIRILRKFFMVWTKKK